MKVKKSKSYGEFHYCKSNNEQVAELTLRLEELRKDFKKFSQLVRIKDYEDNHNKDGYDYMQSNLNKTILNVLNEFTNLVQYTGQYTQE